MLALLFHFSEKHTIMCSNHFLKKNNYIMLITAVKVIPGYWKEDIIGEWPVRIEITLTKPLFAAAQMMVKHAKPSAIVRI